MVLLMNVSLGAWTFEDDNGDRFPMKDPAPSQPKGNLYECYNNVLYRSLFIENNLNFGIPIRADHFVDTFYESTDDPNVWIEHHDEEFDDFDEWPV